MHWSPHGTLLAVIDKWNRPKFRPGRPPNTNTGLTFIAHFGNATLSSFYKQLQLCHGESALPSGQLLGRGVVLQLVPVRSGPPAHGK